MSGLYLLVAVVLLVANAIFVAVEFALIAARRSRLELQAEEGNRRARLALAAMNDINRQMAGAQLGITMTSLGLGFVAEPAVARLLERAIESFVELPSGVLHTISFVVALILVVFLHMVIGEMVPKSIALTAAERSAMWLAPLNRVYAAVFGPLIGVLDRLSRVIVRALGVQPIDRLSTAHTAAEIAAIVERSAAEGLLDDFDRELLSSAVDLTSRPVRTVMVPREKVVAVKREATVAEVLEVIRTSGHSRVLVQQGSVDDPVGFVHAKDLLEVTGERTAQPLDDSVIRTVHELDEEVPLEEALLLMRQSHRHLAVVRSADRSRTVGLITLEDVLEVLVGDIIDETDHWATAAPGRAAPAAHTGPPHSTTSAGGTASGT